MSNIVERCRRYVTSTTSLTVSAVAFLITTYLFYRYEGLAWTAQWAGSIAAVWSTVYLIYKHQAYWPWTVAYSVLWGILFFQLNLNVLGAYQFITILLCISGMVQWYLVKRGIGVNFARLSDRYVTGITTIVVGFAIWAYWPVTGINIWWVCEIGSVILAVFAIWGDAFRYKGNWICWILSNLFFWPLTVEGKLWGPFIATFVYTAIDIVGFYHWRKEEREGVEDVDHKKKPRKEYPLYTVTDEGMKELI